MAEPQLTGPLAVVCEGPSCLALTPAMLAGQTIAAVNSAPLAIPGLAHMWCTQDPLGRYINAGPAHAVIEALPLDCPWFTCDDWVGPFGRSIETNETSAALFLAGIAWSTALPTSIVAAMWGIRHGYSPVTLYGADMRGWGSPVTPWAPYRDGENPRWVEERRVLGEVMAQWPAIRLAKAETGLVTSARAE